MPAFTPEPCVQPMTKPLIFIDGEQGTTGLLVHQQLAARGDISLLTLPAAQRKSPAHRAEALNSCDLAILCLPDDAAREAVALVRCPGVRLLDASSAHRTAPGWVYGLPELSSAQADAVRHAGRVSNPGCYPTGMLALVKPLVDAGLLPRDLPLVVHAVSGYSGRGRAGVDAHEGPGATSAPAFQVYGLGLQHKHVAEMQQHAGLTQPPLFLPAYGAYRQGIVLCIGLHARQLPAAATAQAMHAALAAHFAGQPTVEVAPLADSQDPACPPPNHLDPQACNGSNRLRLQVLANSATGHTVLAAVFDNLGKGASGAAVQNMALMLGLAPGPELAPEVAVAG